MNYIQWTNKLVEYFFPTNSEQETYLYIDDDTLNQIGQDLGGSQDFLETFIFPYEQSIEVYDTLYRDKYQRPATRTPQDNRRLLTPNILQFANFIKERLQFPYYFPYAVLVMYYVYLASKENRTDYGAYVREELDVTNYTMISDLFNQLHQDKPSFKNRLRTNQRIVGLLKYQFLLTPADTREINEALYRVSYDSDCHYTYTESIRKIKDFVSNNVKGILRDSLTNPIYQYRISSILDNFDLESYTPVHTDTEVSKCMEFALLLDFSDGRGFRLLSNYRPSNRENIREDRNNYVFTPSIDSIGQYSNNYVEYNGSTYVDLGEYTLKGRNIEFKPIPLRDVAFFYKNTDDDYLQSRETFDREVYIFVKKSSIQQWEQWAQTYARNCQRIDNIEEVSDLTNNHWALYIADGILAPYYLNENGWSLINRVKEIESRGGIKCPGINTYLVNAIPYLEFPVEIRQEKLSLNITKENQELAYQTDYVYYIQNNRLIIDLVSDIGYDQSQKIELDIEYPDPDHDRTYSFHDEFFVRGQSIDFRREELYRYNKWGDKTNMDCTFNIQGNHITGTQAQPLGNRYYAIGDHVAYDEIPRDSFYFINILASCIYKDDHSQITRQQLKKCINYASTRLNIDVNEKGFDTKVISRLVQCGYLAADYDSSHYQAIPPSFNKIPRSFQAGIREQLWMLTGAYTRKFLDELLEYCRNQNIQIEFRYSEVLDQSQGSLKLLPPIILISSGFNPEQFQQQHPHHKFDIVRDDQALNILSIIPSIDTFKETLTRIPKDNFNLELLAPPKSTVFPRIREDNPYAYNNHVYIEEDNSNDGYLLRSSVSDKWHELYCLYRGNIPFVIKKESQILLPEDLHLPSLIHRSLYIMNVGIPTYKKIFICDKPSNYLYEEVQSYKVNDDRIDNLLNKLTHGNQNLIKGPVRTRIGPNTYHMELWRKKKSVRFKNNLPSQLIVLYCRIAIDNVMAVSGIFSTGVRHQNIQKTFIMQNDQLMEIQNPCNETMSMFIQNRNDNIQLMDNGTPFVLPERNNYNIEELIIG